MKTVALFAILCGCLLIFGGESGDRMRLSAISERRLLTVIVALPDVDESYRWLSIYGCSAMVQEFGAACTGDFERESSFELTGGRIQHLVYWRDLPGGTMMLTAMAFGADQKLLASATRVVFRGPR